MANQEHLDILAKGVDAWNEWRAKEPHKDPNLDEVDLRGVDLHQYNLAHTWLRHARLDGANFYEARVAAAHFSHSSLD